MVPPTSVDPRLPRELDAIVAKALAYDPDRRYADARSFGDALVDVLFPTPQSSIQDLLGRQMQQVFSEKIVRQRNARAHDPLIMKVLANAAEKQAEAEYERLSAEATPGPGAHGTPFEPYTATDAADALDTARAPVRRPSRPRTVIREGGVRVSTALLVGLILAVAGAAGLHYGETWLRPGVLVVTSDPPGAAVTLDGVATGQVTPAVLEVPLSSRHEVVLEGAGVRGAGIAVEPVPGRMVRRVHARLQSALGSVTVRSVPPGAAVRLDDRVVGATPLTVRELRMDERHRFDLTLAGYDLDQFVVLPEKDGAEFSRTLARASARPQSATEKPAAPKPRDRRRP